MLCASKRIEVVHEVLLPWLLVHDPTQYLAGVEIEEHRARQQLDVHQRNTCTVRHSEIHILLRTQRGLCPCRFVNTASYLGRQCAARTDHAHRPWQKSQTRTGNISRTR